MPRLTPDQYRQVAHALWHSSGTLEVDPHAVVSVSDNHGAYVAAWVWVDDPDDAEETET
jgi:hypothetical protein